MRILPYRTQRNAIAGIVITFVDISRQKALQQEIQQLLLEEQAHSYAGRIFETVREPLLVLDTPTCV